MVPLGILPVTIGIHSTPKGIYITLKGKHATPKGTLLSRLEFQPISIPVNEAAFLAFKTKQMKNYLAPDRRLILEITMSC